MEVTSFHWADYLLCALSLLMSLAIGVYYGIQSRHYTGHETEEFLLAGRNLQILPVSLSIFVSWLSAISFLGDPVEVYYNGVVYMYIGLGYCLALPPVAHMFAPVFHKMKIVSAYEYLNIRYNHTVQAFVSVITIVCGCLYLGIVIYGPSVTLSQVTGIKEWISILLIGSVGTFYTVIGGIRAVVWADAVQSVIMVTGLIAILIQGVINVGGITKMWQVALLGDRINYAKNSWSPVVRSTPWAYVVGGFARVLVPYTALQAFVQRYCTLPNVRSVQIAIYLNIPMYVLMIAIFTLLGLTMYAYYEGCDPLLNGRINHADQLMPLFMLDMLGFLPGMPGIFLASIFAASLSTLSSLINSFAANIVKDFIQPVYWKRKQESIPDHLTIVIAKFTTLFFGVLTTLLAFLILFIKSDIFPLTLKITGMLWGPVAAMFFLGMYFVFVETWSVLAGGAISLFFCAWLGIGNIFYPSPDEKLSTNMGKCYNSSFGNDSSEVVTVSTYNYTSDLSSRNLYNLSPLLYSPLGYVVTVVCTLLLSLCKLCWKSIANRGTREGNCHRAKESENIKLDIKQAETNIPI